MEANFFRGTLLQSMIWVVLILIGWLSACDKPLFDFRKKFTGDWEFVVSTEVYDITNNVQIETSETTKSGSVRLGEASDEITIDLGDGAYHERIDKDGNFKCECGSITRKVLHYSRVQIQNTGGQNPQELRVTIEVDGEKE